MAKITYIEHDGTEHRVEVEEGLSVMRGAVDNGVPGIDADCGGQCACATCHVFVDEAWLARTGDKGEQEESMLSFAAAATSRMRVMTYILVSGYRSPYLTAKAAASTRSGFACAAVSSAVTRPWRSTRTRWDMLMTSSISEEIRRTAMPSAASSAKSL